MTKSILFGILLAGAVYAGTGDIESRVTEFTLKNGLQTIVYVDSSAPVVSVNAYYKVGSYDEAVGSTGISHMLEHMTFKHTDVYKPGEFDRLVDEAGGYNNGFTATYFTGYYEDLARDRWELGLKLEAARMAKCIFPDSEFESEHQVVSEERRLADNRPQSAFFEQYEGIAYVASPLRNPGIGWSDDVRRLTVGAVRDWYTRRYNPANAVLIIAGDVRPDDVKARVEKYFGKLKGVPVARTDFYDIEPKQTGERGMTMRRQISVPLVLMSYHMPGIRDTSFYAGLVLAGVLGSGRSSRLYHTLVIDSGLSTNAYVSAYSEKDPGLFQVYANPKAESLFPRIRRVVEQELTRVGNELISERELEQVKNGVLAEYMFARDDISDVARILGMYQIAYGDWRAYKEYTDRLSRVTREQVRDFAAAWLKRDNLTIGTLVPERKAGK